MAKKEDGIIPEDLLNEWRSLSEKKLDGSETGSEENNEAQTSDFEIKLIEKTGAWALDLFDRSMKKKGAPGLNNIPGKELASYSVMAFEEEIRNSKGIKDAPKYMVALTLAGLLTQNLVYLKRNEPKKEETPGEDVEG